MTEACSSLSAKLRMKRFSNRRTCRGKEQIEIKCVAKDGEWVPITIKEALYVPDLEDSLISVKKLTENGLKVEFKDSTCTIAKNNKIVAVADLIENLYRLRRGHEAKVVSGTHSRNCQHLAQETRS